MVVRGYNQGKEEQLGEVIAIHDTLAEIRITGNLVAKYKLKGAVVIVWSPEYTESKESSIKRGG